VPLLLIGTGLLDGPIEEPGDCVCEFGVMPLGLVVELGRLGLKLGGKDGGPGPATDVELGQQPQDNVLDGTLGQEHCVADLFIRLSLGDPIRIACS
jgi:hypothetical protein